MSSAVTGTLATVALSDIPPAAGWPARWNAWRASCSRPAGLLRISAPLRYKASPSGQRYDGLPAANGDRRAVQPAVDAGSGRRWPATGADWYTEDNMQNPALLALADKVTATVTPEFTQRMNGPARQPGARCGHKQPWRMCSAGTLQTLGQRRTPA